MRDIADMIDTIICGDCLEVMRGMTDECVDLVVTDPPYGMAFMGKAWDKALPSVEVWRECLRVLKPGAFAFVMCIPRQDCQARMILNLEEAGFDIGFTDLEWTFATGFPKAANISKFVDKRMGVEREVVGINKGLVGRKDGAIWGKSIERPWKDKVRSGEYNNTLATIPTSPEAKALDGAYAGFQPKPCREKIIVAMRPLSEKTYLDQALANGKGCTWLDDGRIPYENGDDAFEKGEQRSKYPRADIRSGNFRVGITSERKHMVPNGMSRAGRFAPNLLVSGDVLNDGEKKRSGGIYNCKHTQNTIFGNVTNWQNPKQMYNDTGSYSRYFSLEAWAAKNLPESVNRTFPFFIVPKASKSEKNAGLDGLEEKEMWMGHAKQINGSGKPAKQIISKNHHPTVKPIKLMSYLIAIGSRPGDVVLDPYAGSGTTGVAAELLDRRYILMELDAEYCDIAERRIAWHVEQAKEEEQVQLKLDFNV